MELVKKYWWVGAIILGVYLVKKGYIAYKTVSPTVTPAPSPTAATSATVAAGVAGTPT